MKQLLYFLSAATLFVTGCSKELPGDTLQGQQEIQFRTFIEEGGEIRPISEPKSRTMAGDLAAGYRLNALLTTSSYPVAAPNRLMWNVEMNRNGSYKYTSEKPYFWAEGNAAFRHTFVAYSANPTGTATGEGVDHTTLAIGGDGRLSVDYSTPLDPAKQIDFLYSENVRNVTVGSSVPVVELVFKHRMARVMVKLMGTGGATLIKCQAKIAYKANTVRNKATLTLSDNGAISFHNNNYLINGTENLGPEFSLPGSASSSATAVEMGDLILLPGQSLAEGWATLSLAYTPDGGTTPQNVSTPLPALTLATGKQHEILVNVIVESSNLSVSSVTLTNWNSKTGTIDKL